MSTRGTVNTRANTTAPTPTPATDFDTNMTQFKNRTAKIRFNERYAYYYILISTKMKDGGYDYGELRISCSKENFDKLNLVDFADGKSAIINIIDGWLNSYKGYIGVFIKEFE